MILKLLTSCSLVLAIVLSGCGDSEDKAKVTGKVTFNGDPVTVGALAFTTEDGVHTKGADIQSDGSYVFEEVVVGTHVVEYSTPFAEGPGDEGWEQVKMYVNCKVADNFRAKVESGENSINIELVKGSGED